MNPEETPLAFKEVEPNSPVPANCAAFILGEVLPLKGVNWKIIACNGDKLLLQAIGQTSSSKKRIEAQQKPKRSKTKTKRG